MLYEGASGRYVCAVQLMDGRETILVQQFYWDFSADISPALSPQKATNFAPTLIPIRINHRITCQKSV